jgi:hypothetical protein
MQFVQAKWYTKTDGRDVRLQVIHDMEAKETSSTAEAVAHDFATTTTKKSAHYCYDDDSTVQCVRDQDVAYAAPGANHDGLHHELAGFARQLDQEWRDKFSLAMLARVAVNVAKKCEANNNPKTWLSDAEVLAGKRGICDHWTITRVYKKTTHTDVGPNFPKDLFIDMVRASGLLVQSPTPQGGFTIMNNCVAVIECPIDHGFQKLQSDGAVFNSDGCSHYAGSYLEPTMATARQNQPVLPFVDIVRVPGGSGANYVIVRQDGAVYGPDFGYGLV